MSMKSPRPLVSAYAPLTGLMRGHGLVSTFRRSIPKLSTMGTPSAWMKSRYVSMRYRIAISGQLSAISNQQSAISYQEETHAKTVKTHEHRWTVHPVRH